MAQKNAGRCSHCGRFVEKDGLCRKPAAEGCREALADRNRSLECQAFVASIGSGAGFTSVHYSNNL